MCFSASASFIAGAALCATGVATLRMTARKAEIPLAPIVLALVLGDLMEANYRRAMGISKGSLDIFLQHPISLALLAIAILSFALPVLAKLTGWRGRRSA